MRRLVGLEDLGGFLASWFVLACLSAVAALLAVSLLLLQRVLGPLPRVVYSRRDGLAIKGLRAEGALLRGLEFILNFGGIRIRRLALDALRLGRGHSLLDGLHIELELLDEDLTTPRASGATQAADAIAATALRNRNLAAVETVLWGASGRPTPDSSPSEWTTSTPPFVLRALRWLAGLLHASARDTVLQFHLPAARASLELSVTRLALERGLRLSLDGARVELVADALTEAGKGERWSILSNWGAEVSLSLAVPDPADVQECTWAVPGTYTPAVLVPSASEPALGRELLPDPPLVPATLIAAAPEPAGPAVSVSKPEPEPAGAWTPLTPTPTPPRIQLSVRLKALQLTLPFPVLQRMAIALALAPPPETPLGPPRPRPTPREDPAAWWAYSVGKLRALMRSARGPDASASRCSCSTETHTSRVALRARYRELYARSRAGSEAFVEAEGDAPQSWTRWARETALVRWLQRPAASAIASLEADLTVSEIVSCRTLVAWRHCEALRADRKARARAAELASSIASLGPDADPDTLVRTAAPFTCAAPPSSGLAPFLAALAVKVTIPLLSLSAGNAHCEVASITLEAWGAEGAGAKMHVGDMRAGLGASLSIAASVAPGPEAIDSDFFVLAADFTLAASQSDALGADLPASLLTIALEPLEASIEATQLANALLPWTKLGVAVTSVLASRPKPRPPMNLATLMKNSGTALSPSLALLALTPSTATFTWKGLSLSLLEHADRAAVLSIGPVTLGATPSLLSAEDPVSSLPPALVRELPREAQRRLESSALRAALHIESSIAFDLRSVLRGRTPASLLEGPPGRLTVHALLAQPCGPCVPGAVSLYVGADIFAATQNDDESEVDERHPLRFLVGSDQIGLMASLGQTVANQLAWLAAPTAQEAMETRAASLQPESLQERRAVGPFLCARVALPTGLAVAVASPHDRVELCLDGTAATALLREDAQVTLLARILEVCVDSSAEGTKGHPDPRPRDLQESSRLPPTSAPMLHLPPPEPIPESDEDHGAAGSAAAEMRCAFSLAVTGRTDWIDRPPNPSATLGLPRSGVRHTPAWLRILRLSLDARLESLAVRLDADRILELADAGQRMLGTAKDALQRPPEEALADAPEESYLCVEETATAAPSEALGLTATEDLDAAVLDLSVRFQSPGCSKVRIAVVASDLFELKFKSTTVDVFFGSLPEAVRAALASAHRGDESLLPAPAPAEPVRAVLERGRAARALAQQMPREGLRLALDVADYGAQDLSPGKQISGPTSSEKAKVHLELRLPSRDPSPSDSRAGHLSSWMFRGEGLGGEHTGAATGDTDPGLSAVDWGQGLRLHLGNAAYNLSMSFVLDIVAFVQLAVSAFNPEVPSAPSTQVRVQGETPPPADPLAAFPIRLTVSGAELHLPTGPSAAARERGTADPAREISAFIGTAEFLMPGLPPAAADRPSFPFTGPIQAAVRSGLRELTGAAPSDREPPPIPLWAAHFEALSAGATLGTAPRVDAPGEGTVRAAPGLEQGAPLLRRLTGSIVSMQLGGRDHMQILFPEAAAVLSRTSLSLLLEASRGNLAERGRLAEKISGIAGGRSGALGAAGAERAPETDFRGVPGDDGGAGRDYFAWRPERIGLSIGIDIPSIQMDLFDERPLPFSTLHPDPATDRRTAHALLPSLAPEAAAFFLATRPTSLLRAHLDAACISLAIPAPPAGQPTPSDQARNPEIASGGESLGVRVAMSSVRFLDLSLGPGGVTLAQGPASIPPDELPHHRPPPPPPPRDARQRRATNEPPVPLEVTICSREDGSVYIKVGVDGLVLAYPYVFDGMLVNRLATIFDPLPAPRHGPPMYVTEPLPWLHVQVQVTDTQLILPVCSTLPTPHEETRAPPRPGPRPTPSPLLDPASALSIERKFTPFIFTPRKNIAMGRGLAVTLGLVGVRMRQGGNGELHLNVAADNLSVRFRAKGEGRVRTLLAPSALTLTLAAAYPQIEEQRMLQQQTAAAQVILRGLRRWRLRRRLREWRSRVVGGSESPAPGEERAMRNASDFLSSLAEDLVARRQAEREGGAGIVRPPPKAPHAGGKGAVVWRLPLVVKGTVRIERLLGRLPFSLAPMLGDLSSILTQQRIPVRELVELGKELVPLVAEARGTMGAETAVKDKEAEIFRPTIFEMALETPTLPPPRPRDAQDMAAHHLLRSPEAELMRLGLRACGLAFSICDDRPTTRGAPDIVVLSLTRLKGCIELQVPKPDIPGDLAASVSVTVGAEQLSADLGRWTSLLSDSWPVTIDCRDIVSRGFESSREISLRVQSAETATLLVSPDLLQLASELLDLTKTVATEVDIRVPGAVLTPKQRERLLKQLAAAKRAAAHRSSEGPLEEPADILQTAREGLPFAARAQQHFAVRNETGARLFYWSPGENALAGGLLPRGEVFSVGPGEVAELKTMPLPRPCRVVNDLFGAPNEFIPTRVKALALQVEGNWSPVLVNVDVPAKTLYSIPVPSQSRECPLIVDVDASKEGRLKTFAVRSPYRVVNALDRPMTVRVRPDPLLIAAPAAAAVAASSMVTDAAILTDHGSARDLVVRLEPGESYPLPVVCSLGASVYFAIEGCAESHEHVTRVGPHVTAAPRESTWVSFETAPPLPGVGSPGRVHCALQVLMIGPEAGDIVRDLGLDTAAHDVLPGSSTSSAAGLRQHMRVRVDSGALTARRTLEPFEAWFVLRPTIALRNALPIPLALSICTLDAPEARRPPWSTGSEGGGSTPSLTPRLGIFRSRERRQLEARARKAAGAALDVLQRASDPSLPSSEVSSCTSLTAAGGASGSAAPDRSGAPPAANAMPSSPTRHMSGRLSKAFLRTRPSARKSEGSGGGSSAPGLVEVLLPPGGKTSLYLAPRVNVMVAASCPSLGLFSTSWSTLLSAAETQPRARPSLDLPSPGTAASLLSGLEAVAAEGLSGLVSKEIRLRRIDPSPLPVIKEDQPISEDVSGAGIERPSAFPAVPSFEGAALQHGHHHGPHGMTAGPAVPRELSLGVRRVDLSAAEAAAPSVARTEQIDFIVPTWVLNLSGVPLRLDQGVVLGSGLANSAAALTAAADAHFLDRLLGSGFKGPEGGNDASTTSMGRAQEAMMDAMRALSHMALLNRSRTVEFEVASCTSSLDGCRGWTTGRRADLLTGLGLTAPPAEEEDRARVPILTTGQTYPIRLLVGRDRPSSVAWGGEQRSARSRGSGLAGPAALYEFSADVTSGPSGSPYALSRVVIVRSRYLVENNSGLWLLLKQRGLPDTCPVAPAAFLASSELSRGQGVILLAPGGVTPIHFPLAALAPELVIKPASPDLIPGTGPPPATDVAELQHLPWSWSGGFSPTMHESYVGIRLMTATAPPGGKPRSMILPLHAAHAPGTLELLTICSPSAVPPYRIENFCDGVTVRLRQTRTGRAAFGAQLAVLDAGAEIAGIHAAASNATVGVRGALLASRTSSFILEHLQSLPGLARGKKYSWQRGRRLRHRVQHRRLPNASLEGAESELLPSGNSPGLPLAPTSASPVSAAEPLENLTDPVVIERKRREQEGRRPRSRLGSLLSPVFRILGMENRQQDLPPLRAGQRAGGVSAGPSNVAGGNSSGVATGAAVVASTQMPESSPSSVEVRPVDLSAAPPATVTPSPSRSALEMQRAHVKSVGELRIRDGGVEKPGRTPTPAVVVTRRPRSITSHGDDSEEGPGAGRLSASSDEALALSESEHRHRAPEARRVPARILRRAAQASSFVAAGVQATVGQAMGRKGADGGYRIRSQTAPLRSRFPADDPAVVALRPGETLPFAWSQPLQPHSVDLELSPALRGGLESPTCAPVAVTVSLDRLGDLAPLSLPGAMPLVTPVRVSPGGVAGSGGSSLLKMSNLLKQGGALRPGSSVPGLEPSALSSSSLASVDALHPPRAAGRDKSFAAALSKEMSRKVFVTVFADGPTRVLRLSSSPHGTSLQTAREMVDLRAKIAQLQEDLATVNTRFGALLGRRGETTLDLLGRTGLRAPRKGGAFPSGASTPALSSTAPARLTGPTLPLPLPAHAVALPAVAEEPSAAQFSAASPGGGSSGTRMTSPKPLPPTDVSEPFSLSTGSNVNGVAMDPEIQPVSAPSPASVALPPSQTPANMTPERLAEACGGLEDLHGLGGELALTLSDLDLGLDALSTASGPQTRSLVAVVEAEGQERITDVFLLQGPRGELLNGGPEVRLPLVAASSDLTVTLRDVTARRKKGSAQRIDEAFRQPRGRVKEILVGPDPALAAFDVGPEDRSSLALALRASPIVGTARVPLTATLSGGPLWLPLALPPGATVTSSRPGPALTTLTTATSTSTVANGNGAAVTPRVKVAAQWDISERSMLLLRLRTLEEVFALRTEVLAMHEPLDAFRTARWLELPDPRLENAADRRPQAAAMAQAQTSEDVGADALRRKPVALRNLGPPGSQALDKSTSAADPTAAATAALPSAAPRSLETADLERGLLGIKVLAARHLAPSKSLLRRFLTTAQESRLPSTCVEICVPGFNARRTRVVGSSLEPDFDDRIFAFDNVPLSAPVTLRLLRIGRRQVLTGRFAEKELGRVELPSCVRLFTSRPTYAWVALTRADAASESDNEGEFDGNDRERMVASAPTPELLVRLQWTPRAVSGTKVWGGVDLKGLGLTLLSSSAGVELLSVALRRVRVDALATRLAAKVQGSVAWFQVDDEDPQSPYPVIAHPLDLAAPASSGSGSGSISSSSFGSASPAVTFGFTRSFVNATAGGTVGQASRASIPSFEDVRLSLAPFSVDVGDDILSRALDFVFSLPLDKVLGPGWSILGGAREDSLPEALVVVCGMNGGGSNDGGMSTQYFAPTRFPGRRSCSTDLSIVDHEFGVGFGFDSTFTPHGGRLGSGPTVALQMTDPRRALSWLLRRERGLVASLRSQTSASSFVFLEQLEVGPIRCRTSIRLTSRLLGAAAVHGQPQGVTPAQRRLEAVLAGAGFQLMNVANAYLELAPFTQTSLLVSNTALLQLGARHYLRQALTEAHKVLSGVGPSPAGVPLAAVWAAASTFAVGYQLVQRRVGPVGAVARVGSTASMGAGFLLSATARTLIAAMILTHPSTWRGGHGAAEATSGSAAPSATSAVHLSDAAVLDRYVVRPRTVPEALSTGVQEMGLGFAGGVVNLPRDVHRGFTRGGLLGAGTGLARGTLGLILRPVAGLMEGGGRIAQGVGLALHGREFFRRPYATRVDVPQTTLLRRLDELTEGRRAEAELLLKLSHESVAGRGLRLESSASERRRAWDALWDAALPLLHPTLGPGERVEGAFDLGPGPGRYLLLTSRALLLVTCKEEVPRAGWRWGKVVVPPVRKTKRRRAAIAAAAWTQAQDDQDVNDVDMDVQSQSQMLRVKWIESRAEVAEVSSARAVGPFRLGRSTAAQRPRLVVQREEPTESSDQHQVGLHVAAGQPRDDVLVLWLGRGTAVERGVEPVGLGRSGARMWTLRRQGLAGLGDRGRKREIQCSPEMLGTVKGALQRWVRTPNPGLPGPIGAAVHVTAP